MLTRGELDRKQLAILLASTAMAACAGPASGTSSHDVAASPRMNDPLAGVWRGRVWKTAPAYFQGHKQLDIRIGEDGTCRRGAAAEARPTRENAAVERGRRTTA